MKKCMVCNKDFEPSSNRQVFCSEGCKQKNKREMEKVKDPETVLEKARANAEKMNDSLEERGLPRSIVVAADLPKLEFVSSGIPEIDEITGGFPRKRVSEVFGMKGVGKSSLMMRVLRNLPDLSIYYLDSEGGIIDPPDNVTIDNEQILENVADNVHAALDSGKYDLIVVDSVASLTPRAEAEGEMTDMQVGLKARVMSKWMRLVNYHLRKSNTALVFVNQQRQTINQYGSLKFTPGGLALGYAASLRLELRTTKADRILKEKEVVGHWINFEVEKSRICKPFQKGRFKLLYE